MAVTCEECTFSFVPVVSISIVFLNENTNAEINIECDTLEVEYYFEKKKECE